MLNLENREILFNFISAYNLLINQIVEQSNINKVYRSLKMTKIFKSKVLIIYINIIDKIDTNIITELERYPNKIIKLIYENIQLLENIYQNLKDYYIILYELISLSIDKVAIQY